VTDPRSRGHLGRACLPAQAVRGERTPEGARPGAPVGVARLRGRASPRFALIS
jgi:hypothetical protein